MNRYVIFDRDGTLIKKVEYLKDPADIRLAHKSATTLVHLRNLGFRFGIITNQSQIDRHISSYAQVEDINLEIERRYRKFGIIFDFIKICPHLPEVNCECRKPNTKHGEEAINDYKIDRYNSYMIGDTESDMEFGIKLGLRCIRISEMKARKHNTLKYHNCNTFSKILNFIN